VPTAGGIAIITGLGISVLVLPGITDHAASMRALVFVGIIGAAAAGLLDDVAVLRPRTKLALEILVAAFLSTVGPKFNLTLDPIFTWPLTLFWLLTTMNAVNLIDGIDGLAGYLGAISAATTAIIALLYNHWGVAQWSLALVGSIAGFLVFNASPARIFMGDTGALALGAILGVLSIQVSNMPTNNSIFTRLCLPILLLIVPVLDTLTVTVIRIVHGQSISRRGLDHAHHRLGRLGLSDSRIVLVLCMLQAFASLAAIGLSIAPNELAVLATPFVALPFVLVGLFLTDQSFEADGAAALAGLPLVTRLVLNAGYKRRLVDAALDMVLVAAAYFGAFMLRLNFQLTSTVVSSLLHSLPIVVSTAVAALFVTRIYRGIWRYTAGADALRFAEAAVLSAVLVFVAAAVLPINYDLGVGFIFGFLLFILLGVSRLSFHFIHCLVRTFGPHSSRVLVLGADFVAAEAARHLLLDPERRVKLLGFVDNDRLKLGKLIHGRKVLGTIAALDQIFEKHPFDELLLASSSLSPEMMTMVREFAYRRATVIYRFVVDVVRIQEGEADVRSLVSVEQHITARASNAAWEDSVTSRKRIYPSTTDVAISSGFTKVLLERGDPEQRQLAAYRPRVLQVLTEKVRGGIEEHVLSILISLHGYGFEPYLAAPAGLLGQISAELSFGQVSTLAIENASLLNHRSVSCFRGFLTAQHIDIVHSHTLLASMFASPLARMAAVPAIVETFHLPEFWREGKWLKGSFWIDRQVGRFVDQYIAVSRAAQSHLVECKGIAPHRIRVIHNGRDLARFHPPSEAERTSARLALGVDDRQQVLVTLGRLEVQKGHSFLIAALARLATRWPSLVTFFAGTGELEADLMFQRDRAGLGERIKFLGIVRESERVLAAADVVVLPSLFEGLPLTAIEALACARPIVATDICGTREVVIHQRTGLLVPPRDPEALADAIARILSAPTLGVQLGEAGRIYVEDHFDVRMQIEDTVEAYRELFSRKNHERYTRSSTVAAL
jgi:UDP-GlcNAc:undecaprenyl-phosphate/decaprenyl-phosphate GlcNAc-1-phosphate transferase